MGNGFMIDIHTRWRTALPRRDEPRPFGQYDVRVWGETVVRTERNRCAPRHGPADFRCEKYTDDGGAPATPSNIHTFPC